ncbi:hypothetical protein HYW46_05160 [Candidatus Daviesbacteria bacterium]|nr:hypothetical protein [Candidatus Daviesbacteria bacterium]
MKRKLKKILKRAIPLWLVVILILDTSMVVGVVEYLLMRKQFNQAVLSLSKTTDSDGLIRILKQEVIPAGGYTASVKWKNLGQQLVEVGAIDESKYKEIFDNDNMKYLNGNWNEAIQINEKNSRFLVNTFWALGLVNKSKVLEEGPMKGEGIQTGRMASTGGWTMGKMEPMELYSSRELIKLTDQQQELVKKIAQNIYRPCCGNSTYFPDCNHGMAALGYIEYAVYEGVPERLIYKDILALNSYWFPQTYMEIAQYFNRDLFKTKPQTLAQKILKFGADPKKDIKWSNLDPKVLLSEKFSSARGAKEIQQEIEDIGGFQTKGGGCSV